MFSALVEPVLSELEIRINTHKQWDYELLEKDDLDAMWISCADLEMMMELIYQNFDVFKLLICCSEGTKYATFIHDFVIREQKETIAFMQAARLKGISAKRIKPEEFHLLLSAYVTAIFEVVVHDFEFEEAKHYLKTFEIFFTPGWRTVLGL